MREDRLKVLDKIKQLEKEGKFNDDVENDGEYKPLDSKKLDLLRKKFFSKVKTSIAYFFANNYFKSMMRKGMVVLKEPVGLENLAGFQEGAIVTCNHIHPFDNYGVLLSLRKHFSDMGKRMPRVIKESNYSYPGKLGFFMRNCDTLPVSIDERPNLKLTAKSFQVAKTLLEKNKKILIYPEQSMWWNYKKPRPLKKGAFYMAAKFNVPVIPCFYTLKDNPKIDPDGFHVQEFTLNVLPMIYPDPKLSVDENITIMMAKNTQLWKETYEKIYCKSLKCDIINV